MFVLISVFRTDVCELTSPSNRRPPSRSKNLNKQANGPKNDSKTRILPNVWFSLIDIVSLLYWILAGELDRKCFEQQLDRFHCITNS